MLMLMLIGAWDGLRGEDLDMHGLDVDVDVDRSEDGSYGIGT